MWIFLGKTNLNVLIITVIHSDYSQAIHLLNLITQTVVESANRGKRISNADLFWFFLLASLDIVQAVALILSYSLQLNSNSLNHAAADKYEFKYSCVQMEE